MYKLKLFLRNNFFTKKLYYYLFKLKQKGKSKKLKAYMIDVTRDIYLSLENTDYEYAYDFGSLLGLIRDKKFMDHDDDIDLLLIYETEEKLKKLPEVIKPFGFELDHYYICNNQIVEYTFRYKDTGLTVDFFVKHIIDNQLVSYWMYQDVDKAYKNKNEMTVSYTKSCLIPEYKYVNYWGIDLRVPSNSEEVLYWHYGENWSIKDPNYSPKRSPGFEETAFIGFKVDLE